MGVGCAVLVLLLYTSKRAPGGLVVLQEEQRASMAAPHSPQNFIPAGFSKPHPLQVTNVPPWEARL